MVINNTINSPRSSSINNNYPIIINNINNIENNKDSQNEIKKAISKDNINPTKSNILISGVQPIIMEHKSSRQVKTEALAIKVFSNNTNQNSKLTTQLLSGSSDKFTSEKLINNPTTNLTLTSGNSSNPNSNINN